ncbi:MAG: DUF6809 family protein [Anaerocolumna sp.]
MNSILKKLYYSNLNPDEVLYAKDTEYRKLNDQLIEVMELLKQKVTEEDYKVITNLMEIHTESGALEATNAFVYGFKYGALIMIEVLKDI